MDIYLAGKVGPSYPWRRSCVPDMESHTPSLEDVEAGAAWPVIPMGKKFLAHRYVGPYFAPLHEHDFHLHGNEPIADRHGMIEPTQDAVVSLCLGAILRAHLVMAWIEDTAGPPYGTIFELGYAVAHRKKVAVAFSEKVAGDTMDSLWFTTASASFVCTAETPDQALQQVLERFGVAPVTTMPFGIHRGEPITVLLKDPGYYTFLKSQRWFVDRFDYIIRDVERLRDSQ